MPTRHIKDDTKTHRFHSFATYWLRLVRLPKSTRCEWMEPNVNRTTHWLILQ